MARTSRNLDGLQYLRAFAALLVVIYHAGVQIHDNAGAEPFNGWYRLGERGVELFFVLSGFIIYFSHRNDERSWHSVARYTWKRFSRIVPPAFLIATGWITITGVAGWLGLSASSQRFEWRVWASSALVVPMLAQPVPIVIWTLKHEVAFYGIFIVNFFSARLGIVLLAAWALISLVWYPGSRNITYSMLASNYNILFLAGAIAYYIHRRAGCELGWLALPSIITFVAFAHASRGVSNHVGFWSIVLAAPAVATVISMASITIPGVFGALFKFLGNASYSIYLVHFPALAILYRITAPIPLFPEARMLVNALLATFFGAMFYLIAEKPILKSIGRFAPPAPASQVA